MTRLIPALALVLCAGSAMAERPSYVYFCAGDPVPKWIAETKYGDAKLTFYRDAIAKREYDSWEMHPVGDIKEPISIIHQLEEGGFIFAEVIYVPYRSVFYMNGKWNSFSLEPIASDDLTKKNCGVPIS